MVVENEIKCIFAFELLEVKNNMETTQRQYNIGLLWKLVIKADPRPDSLFKKFLSFVFCFMNIVSNIRFAINTYWGDNIGGKYVGIATIKKRDTAQISGDMGKKTVIDGVELGTVEMKVYHENFDMEFLGEVEEVLFDNPLFSVVGANSMVKDCKGVSIGILSSKVFVPYFSEMVLEGFECVVACCDGCMPCVVHYVVNTERPDG